MRDSRVQIGGIVFIMDAKDMSKEQFGKMTNMLKLLKMNTKYYQVSGFC